MLLTIAIIVLFGLILMMVETFVPGGVLGTLGVLCVLAAIGLALFADEFAPWPVWGRALFASSLLMVSSLVMFIWLRCFSGRIFRRTFTLDATIRSPSNGEAVATGSEGVAITELRPLGRAEFAGRRHEVRCETGFAPAGSRVQVIGTEPGNLLVRLV